MSPASSLADAGVEPLGELAALFVDEEELRVATEDVDGVAIHRVSGELASTCARQPMLPTQPSEPMNLMLGLPGLHVITTPFA